MKDAADDSRPANVRVQEDQVIERDSTSGWPGIGAAARGPGAGGKPSMICRATN